MMSTPDRRFSGRAKPTDDDWRRGFAEPDDEENPSRAGRRPPPRPAVAVGAGVFDGADDHDVIHVIVDRSGLVADVVVPQSWRGTVVPRELGHALLTAANNALLGQLADAMERDPAVLQEHAVAPATLLPADLAMSEVADLFN